MVTVKIELVTELNGHTLTWQATGQFSEYVPAKISGPPEERYPAEGGELEDYSFVLNSIEPHTQFRLRDINKARPEYAAIETALYEGFDKYMRYKEWEQ